MGSCCRPRVALGSLLKAHGWMILASPGDGRLDAAALVMGGQRTDRQLTSSRRRRTTRRPRARHRVSALAGTRWFPAHAIFACVPCRNNSINSKLVSCFFQTCILFFSNLRISLLSYIFLFACSSFIICIECVFSVSILYAYVFFASQFYKKYNIRIHKIHYVSLDFF